MGVRNELFESIILTCLIKTTRVKYTFLFLPPISQAFSKWSRKIMFFHPPEHKPLTTASDEAVGQQAESQLRLYSIHFDQIHNGSGVEENP